MERKCWTGVMGLAVAFLFPFVLAGVGFAQDIQMPAGSLVPARPKPMRISFTAAPF
jgi:hypothetical protein